MSGIPTINEHSRWTPSAGGWVAYCAAVLMANDEPPGPAKPISYPVSARKQEAHDASRRV